GGGRRERTGGGEGVGGVEEVGFVLWWFVWVLWGVLGVWLVGVGVGVVVVGVFAGGESVAFLCLIVFCEGAGVVGEQICVGGIRGSIERMFR
ncbi:hypothetical protein RA264_28140, partial [Pseudomonas syringae pv. tagetis]|uniref:hypothetical protein n=1 Tax=Pseudomonas syringae group genomosp. 7 TaxID=251699 RepID=UPI0037701C92